MPYGSRCFRVPSQIEPAYFAAESYVHVGLYPTDCHFVEMKETLIVVGMALIWVLI